VAVSPAVVDAAELVDLDRYPVTAIDSPAGREVVERLHVDITTEGVAILDGFVRPEALAAMVAEVSSLRSRAFLEDVWGTPYLELPDESRPERHPRRHNEHSLTWVIAYDLLPQSSPLRLLYQWEPLKDFIASVLGLPALHRMADPLGALNVTIMDRGHEQGWHFDNTDFVVSLALQASDEGGDFECASAIRETPVDENYDEVASVLHGVASDRVRVLPMTPGTLMIFVGRNSLHRVSKVVGDRPRYVGLLAYDERPDTDSSEIFKLVRYGRAS
jgi:hypothetical protein